MIPLALVETAPAPPEGAFLSCRPSLEPLPGCPTPEKTGFAAHEVIRTLSPLPEHPSRVGGNSLHVLFYLIGSTTDNNS